MDKVLVIGASGLLGYKAMVMGEDSHEMFGTYYTHKVAGKNYFRLDVTKRNEVFKLVNEIKPDFIIDTHTLPNVDYCELHPEEAWEVNVNGTKNMAEAAKLVGAKYAYISTDMVFDGSKLDYTEKDKPHPLNYHSKTKLIGELMLEPLNVNHIIIRTAVLYGNGGIGKAPFAAWIVDKLRKKEPVKIVADQSNNPTLADNVIEVLFKLFKDDLQGIFHATGKDCLSRYDFSIMVAKSFGLDSKLITPISAPEFNQVATKPGKVKMNIGKVERATGIKMLGPEEGLSVMKKQMLEK